MDGSTPWWTPHPLRAGHASQGNTRSRPAEGLWEGASAPPAKDCPEREGVPSAPVTLPRVAPWTPPQLMTLPTPLWWRGRSGVGGARPTPPCTRESKGTLMIISSVNMGQHLIGSPDSGHLSAGAGTCTLAGTTPGTRSESYSRDTRGAPVLLPVTRMTSGIDRDSPPFRRPATPGRGV